MSEKKQNRDTFLRTTSVDINLQKFRIYTKLLKRLIKYEFRKKM